MKITIKDCLQLEVFKNAQVAAGASYIENSVKKVGFLEDASPENVLDYCGQNRQIVLTNFSFVKDDVNKQVEIIKNLATVGTAAVVIFQVGKVLRYISPHIMKAAEEGRMALIIVKDGKSATMTKTAEILYSTLFYGTAEQFDNTLITNTIFHLLDFDKYVDFQSAIRAAATNNNFQMVLLSSDFDPVLTIETMHRTTIGRAVRNARKVFDKGTSSVYTLVDVDGVLTYWGPVKIENDIYYMFIVDNEDSYSTAEITKLAEIIELSMGMWKYTPSSNKRTELIRAIRRGNSSLAYSIKEEVGLKDKYIDTIFLATGHGDGDMPEVERLMEAYCKDIEMELLFMIEGKQGYGIILGDKKRKTALDMFDTIKGDNNIKAFYINGINGIESACEGFRLINESWEFSQEIYPFKRIFSKFDMSIVSNCVHLHLQGGFIRRNFTTLLEPFDEVKGAKAQEMLETLKCFVLDAGMNSSVTAEIMDVHVNTIQYRLKKLSELIGAEITGQRMVPGLTLALALRRLEEKGFVS